MIKSFYLLALFCILSLSYAHHGFLEYENEEANWENEECSWEEDNGWDDSAFDLDDPTVVGKATADADVAVDIQGNSAEEIGAAVKDGIVRIGDALAGNAANTNVIPSTGNPNADEAINGVAGALSGLDDDIKTGAGQVGTDLGNVVTNSVNAVQQTPDDVSGAVGGAVSNGIADLNNRADEIGDQVGGAVKEVVDQIIANVPNAQSNEVIANLNQASDDISAAVSSVVSSTAGNADAIGNAIGNSVGNAVDQGKGAADTAGDAVANLDETMKDNAASIGDAIANTLTNAMAEDPTVTQEQIDQAKTQISQSVTENLQNITPEEIDQDRNGVVQAVNNAINTVQSQGSDASKDVVGVIGALADQAIGQINGN